MSQQAIEKKGSQSTSTSLWVWIGGCRSIASDMPECSPAGGPAGVPGCAFHSFFPPPPFLPAGEYLDAAFLTKLMCIGRELHDFLTLPAQVGGAGWKGGRCEGGTHAAGVAGSWRVGESCRGCLFTQGALRRRQREEREIGLGLGSEPALYRPMLLLPPLPVQDIIIAMGL